MRKTQFVLLVLALSIPTAFAQRCKIVVAKDQGGARLKVDGTDFVINGMNWDYYPIGTDFNYSLWKQPDTTVKEALDNEMALLKNMGVNTIRQYVGVPPRWIRYIYENYGIYTLINHSFGRYGLTIGGVWMPNTDYSAPRVKALLLKEVSNMVETYKDTPGVLMFLLGNENNYGLFWDGAETENIPVDKRKSTHRAVSLYRLFNDAFVEMKKIDPTHPVAICNGDALFMDIIAKECKDVDVLGFNCYRGKSFTDLFLKVKEATDKPMMLTEFGADAFNSVTNMEDQKDQAVYDLANWKEIYSNAAGMGKAGNCIGGFTFQFSDGWWKYKQTADLDVHNINASWINGGYQYDYVPKENNMNEEWFGICAKGQTNSLGCYQLYPRTAYYALKEAHKFNPYSQGASGRTLDEHFASINFTDAMLRARSDAASYTSEQSKKVNIGLRGELTTFNTGGSLITTPKEESTTTASSTTYPNKLGFDHMESFYLDVDGKLSENISAKVSVNILGNVASNPIDEVFYENRARIANLTSNGTTYDLSGAERVKLYQASFIWDDKWFALNGFYRTGHAGWGYEGDFFGLYPEANYGSNLDIYHGEIMGVEMEGKKGIDGLKVAYGPQLWWGANPSLLAKYSRKVSIFDITGIFQDDLDKNTSTTSSVAIPVAKNRKAMLGIKTKIGAWGIELGGIWAGSTKLGESFQIVDGSPGSYSIYTDKIHSKDTWGAKAKVTLRHGSVNWYAQSAAMGLVADGGADYTKTFTGWRLKDSGSGNQYNFLSGFAYGIGNFQIAPNFLWQKPIIGPVPSGATDKTTGYIATPRVITTDPFAVRANRETVAGELLLAYDPTPATWMWEWNNDEMENATFAASADFVYRHLPTTQDATVGFMADRTMFVFGGAPSAHDLWETNIRAVSKVKPGLAIITNLYFGNGQANGVDERIIKRFGGDVRAIYKKIKWVASVKINDWGPYDYHRDYNLTYPLQFMADLSTSARFPNWFGLPDTKFGIRCTWRSLDQYSPRYAPVTYIDDTGTTVPDPYAKGYGRGQEWEIRTYVHFNIGR
ncbi:MAG: hypothetical protein H6Q14_837 [Bacteroidetes bacterium]|nr:hypothetical protein [Bacteroidota bacterium]